ncbi:MAG: uroporphyrinogen-III C-methyltransferase, partial [Pseudomonadota bacterium]
VAVIENGTRANELQVFGMLGGLSELMERHGITGPALLIIGEVAGLGLEALKSQALSAEAAQ